MATQTDVPPSNVEVLDSKPEEDLTAAEKQEETKLRSKYPNIQKPGGSDFLRKRLQKGQKYFDSGDYNVAKQTGALKGKSNGDKMPPPPPPPAAVPRADELAAYRKSAQGQSKLAT